jgi:hypothetical protein
MSTTRWRDLRKQERTTPSRQNISNSSGARPLPLRAKPRRSQIQTRPTPAQAGQNPCHNKNPPHRAKRGVTAKRKGNPNRAFGVTYSACDHLSAGFFCRTIRLLVVSGRSEVLLSPGAPSALPPPLSLLELSRELADVSALTSIRFNTKRRRILVQAASTNLLLIKLDTVCVGIADRCMQSSFYSHYSSLGFTCGICGAFSALVSAARSVVGVISCGYS